VVERVVKPRRVAEDEGHRHAHIGRDRTSAALLKLPVLDGSEQHNDRSTIGKRAEHSHAAHPRSKEELHNDKKDRTLSSSSSQYYSSSAMEDLAHRGRHILDRSIFRSGYHHRENQENHHVSSRHSYAQPDVKPADEAARRARGRSKTKAKKECQQRPKAKMPKSPSFGTSQIAPTLPLMLLSTDMNAGFGCF
jgi:hypothetical protein